MAICVICKKPLPGYIGGDGLCKEHGDIAACPSCGFPLQMMEYILTCRKCQWTKEIWSIAEDVNTGEQVVFRKENGKVIVQRKLKGR